MRSKIPRGSFNCNSISNNDIIPYRGILLTLCTIICTLMIVLIAIAYHSLEPNIFVKAKLENVVDSENLAPLTNKGRALYELGNHTGAIDYFDKVLAIKPNDVESLI